MKGWLDADSRDKIQQERLRRRFVLAYVEDDHLLRWMGRNLTESQVLRPQMYDYILKRLPTWSRFVNRGLAEAGIEHFLFGNRIMYRRRHESG